MRFAICTANFGSWADPRLAMRAAAAAQKAGWDGYFVWDHLAFVWGPPSGDPWVLLAAAATAADGLTLGTAVTPLPRRRPQVLAQQAATLARLNGGRVVIGAGLGGNRREFEVFGDDYERARRVERFDAGIAVLRELAGDVPIWVGGNSRDLLERAAASGGWIANSLRHDQMTMTPEDVAEKGRGVTGDVAVNGYSTPEDGALVHAYEDAGATWWLENLHDMRGTPDELIERIGQGPASS